MRLSMALGKPKSFPIVWRLGWERATLGRGAPKKPERHRSIQSTSYLILMWPCMTTINVQKFVYGPRSAVRGSGIG